MHPQIETRVGVLDPIQDLIEEMVRAVVDLPDEIYIERSWSDSAITYRVYVAPSDIGKAVGREGRIAIAMREIAKSSAAKNGQRIYLGVNASETTYPN